jgi:hypothetical protein
MVILREQFKIANCCQSGHAPSNCLFLLCVQLKVNCFKNAVTKTAADRSRSQLNSDCLNANCTDETVLSTAKLLTARHVRSAAYNARLPHSDVLNDPSVCSDVTNTLMSELLPTYIGCSESQKVDLQCQAFTNTADALVAQLKSHLANPADDVPLAAHVADPAHAATDDASK